MSGSEKRWFNLLGNQAFRGSEAEAVKLMESLVSGFLWYPEVSIQRFGTQAQVSTYCKDWGTSKFSKLSG